MKHMQEFKRVLHFIKPRWFTYTLGLLGSSVTGAAASALTAFAVKDLLDAAVNRQLPLLIRALELICIMALGLCILAPLFNYLFRSSVKRITADIRLKTILHLESMKISFFEKTHSGDTVSRLNNDIQAMEAAYSDHIHLVVCTVVSGLSSAVLMFIFDVRTAVILIALGILSAFANSRFAGPIRRIGDMIQQRLAVMTERLSDIMDGHKVIKLFHLKKLVDSRFERTNDDVASTSMAQVRVESLQTGANYMLGWLNFGGIMLIGALMALFGTLSFGKLAANIQLLNGVTFMFLQLGSFLAMLQSSMAGAARVFELLDLPAERERLKCERFFSNEYIELRNIDYCYEEGKKALDGLSMKIARGQVAALAGPSGGGKSTLVKMLMGFYEPGSGGMVIAGRPLGSYTLEELRMLISYVPQDAWLFDGTIAENIGYGNPYASFEEIMQAARAANAHDFIMEQPNGYDTLVGEQGVRLSGGQRQRIAIARAFLKDAPILVLDEATSALDSESEELVREALNVLMKGRTVIAIAHRLSTIENADVIYVIDEGRVVEKGSHSELTSNTGLYRQLFELQS